MKQKTLVISVLFALLFFSALSLLWWTGSPKTRGAVIAHLFPGRVCVCVFCQQIKATVSIFKNHLLQPEAQRVLQCPLHKQCLYAATVTSKALRVVLVQHFSFQQGDQSFCIIHASGSSTWIKGPPVTSAQAVLLAVRTSVP